MPELPVNLARKNFSDAVNRAAYAKERIVLTRRRKGIAALVPVEDLKAIEEAEDRRDLKLARRILAQARRKGEKFIPIEQLKKELGL